MSQLPEKITIHGGPCDGQQVYQPMVRGWAMPREILVCQPVLDGMPPTRFYSYLLDRGVYRYAPDVRKGAA